MKMIIEGKELPPLKIDGPGSPTGDVQQVLKPDAGRSPGFPEGSPSPA